MSTIREIFQNFDRCEQQNHIRCSEQETRIVVHVRCMEDRTVPCPTCGTHVLSEYEWVVWSIQNVTPETVLADLPHNRCLNCGMKQLAELGYKACQFSAHRFTGNTRLAYMCRETFKNNKVCRH